MKAKTLDGKKLSENILKELKKEIINLNKQIKLGVISVGENKVSEKYIERKKKIGEELGIEVKIYKYDKDITTKKLREKVGTVCRMSNMKGVIVQLPLPKHINTQGILDAVLLEKDVDVLSAKALGKLYVGKSPILPPTVSGILKLFEEYKIELKGKTIATIGQGRLVGKPASIVLEQKGATVLAINKYTSNKNNLIKQADIIISGVGKAGLITKNMVKKNAVVVDAGTTVESGKLVGDIAENVASVASYITPVPRGVGPMTVAMLFWNLLELSKK